MIDTRRTLSAMAMLCALLSPRTLNAQDDAKPPSESERVDPPKLIEQPPLELEGATAPLFVELDIVVRSNGSADSAVLIEAGDPALDTRALDAVAALRFEPARKNDEAIDVRIRYRMLFTPPVADDPYADVAADEGPPPAPQPPKPSAPVSAETAAPLEDESYAATAEVRRPPREVTRHSVEGEELARVPGTRGDPLRAIEIMPGVGRTGIGDGAPRLRGSSPTDSMTLIAGEPTPLLYHFGGLTSVVHPSLLSRIDLYPGNFSARYGRIGGGVVSASLRDPRTDGFHGELNLSLIDSSVLVETPLGEDVAVALAARRSNIDLFFGAFMPEDGPALIAAPVYYDFQALLTARLGSDHVLRFVGLGSHDALELFLDEPADADPTLSGAVAAGLAFYRARLSLESRLSDWMTQDISASYGVVDSTVQIGSTDATYLQHVLNARLEYQARLDSTVSLTFGADFVGQIIDGVYTGERPPQGEGDPNIRNADNGLVEVNAVITQLQPAAYAELAYRPHPDLLIQPGVRVDYYDQLRKVSLDPRLVVRYRVAENTTLKSGVGLFSQPPVYWESAAELGNVDLDVTRALHLGLGIEQNLFDRVELSLDGFYKQLTDRVVATPGGVTPYFINDGDGRIYGLETSVRARPIEGMTAYLAYTFSRSERSEHGGPYRLFDEDQTHNLATALSYHFGSGWGVGARFRLISGHPQTPITGASFNANAGVYTPLYGAINGARGPLFHQLDLNAEKKWSFESWSLTAYLSVLNVYNHQAEEGRSYSYNYRASEPILGLPILPSLGLKGEL